MTAADVHERWLLNGNACAGDILSWKRHHMGVSLPQLARADGRWSIEEVAALEATRTPRGPDVARYLAALEAAQRPVHRGRR